MHWAQWWHTFWIDSNNGNWWNVAEGVLIPMIPLAVWAELKHRATGRKLDSHHAELVDHHRRLREHLHIRDD
jgi:hypothetical protein